MSEVCSEMYIGIPFCFTIFMGCTTPMEALRSASKCNTIPEKQYNLLKNKLKNNTIIKLLTYNISPTTECWLRGTTKNISLSLNNTQMDQQHTNVTREASTDPMASPEYTRGQNFATSPKPNFSNVNSSDDPNSDHHKKFSGLG
jgi:hypothetical protein